MNHTWGVNSDGRYCVVSEEHVLENIIMECWPFEFRAGHVEQARRNARRALDNWLSQGLPHRRQGEHRLFDIFQVLNFLRTTVARRAEWDNPLPVIRRQVEELWPRKADRAVQGRHDPCRFRILLGRDFNLEGSQPGRPVRLRLPLPIDDAAQDSVAIESISVSVPAEKITRLPGRLEVQVAEPPDRVSIDVRLEFSSWCTSFKPDDPGPGVAPLADNERLLYTRPSEGLIQVTPAIARLAESLAGPHTAPWQAVRAFWNFLQAKINPGFIHHDEQDPADRLGCILERGWADCLHADAVLASLCRARDIPARIVHGMLLYPVTPGDHYWLEVFLAGHGWVPVDTFSFYLSRGGHDSPWKDCFLGNLDYRMKTECLPHAITGMTGVKFPPSWYMISAMAGEGVEQSFLTPDNRPLYRNRFASQKVSPCPA